jgi:poly(A) polymerase
MADPAIKEESIDADAAKVIRRLVRNGFEAYLVGGCVRDLLVGRKPKDFDVATSATPSEIRDIFRNCRIIGRRFRLAHVFFGPKIIETATFRANPREVLGDDLPEGEEPAELLIRHDNVFGTAEEDARRRDFTINGLFYDLGPGQVIDYVDGMTDLSRRSVRTIGDPDIRFREDPVRILRAIKFAARLGFDIEDREEIGKSAPPRVLEEIFRLLRGGASLESVILLRETGLLTVLVPEVEVQMRNNPAALDPYLRAADELMAAGEVLPNATLLCLLLCPELRPLLDEKESERVRDAGEFIDAAIGPLLGRLRVSRRDAERMRQILLGQRRLWQMRRRPVRPGAVAQRDWYKEALQVHALYRISTGTPAQEVFAELAPLRRLQGSPGGPGFEPGPTTVSEGLDEGERRPRRRRGGRGRAPAMGKAEAAGVDGPAKPADGAERADRFDPASDEDPVENEEAALAAYTAALNANRYDD